MFDVDGFVADCVEARADDDWQHALKELLDRAVADSTGVQSALGTTVAGPHRVYVSDDLTILNVVWAPHMFLRPHDHRMWAAIGVYGGTEDNSFFRRADGSITASGAKRIESGDAIMLGKETIHSVSNPRDKHTGAIHIYGGNFFTQPRSEWDPETLVESPHDVEKLLRFFEEANKA